MSRIWRAFGLEPHLVKDFELSPDPTDSGRWRRNAAVRSRYSNFAGWVVPPDGEKSIGLTMEIHPDMGCEGAAE